MTAREDCIRDYALREANDVALYVDKVSDAGADAIVKEIGRAKRIFLGGSGRSLLSMKMFAMRLMQIGLIPFIVGEVCTPSIGEGDLLMVASCSGTTETSLSLIRKARARGARAAIFTANCEKVLSELADCEVLFPDPNDFLSERHSGEPEDYLKLHVPHSVFEAGLVVVTDAVIIKLMVELNRTRAGMKKNHANLE